MSEYARFNQRMLRISKDMERRANKIVKDAAKAAAFALVDGTPVDRGDAVSNWQAGLGYRPVSRYQAYIPGSKGSTAAGNRRSARAALRAEIDRRKTGQTIYLVNNVPYMDRLNSGWSKKAPAGFIERAVAEGNEVFRRARVLRD